MPRILAAASALPPYNYSQEEIRYAVGRLFSDRLPELQRLLSVFDHSRIGHRQFMRPLEWYLAPSSPADRNRIYREEGLQLLLQAATNCLGQAGCEAGAVDHLIFVSSTGLATPTLDAHLINALGLKPGTSRLPIWGLGCAGGAAGLARAFDYCRAHPRSRVLLTALETCSLTFLPEDRSKKNLVATAIFADGAAAVLVAGNEADPTGSRLLATRSHLFPESERIMGWDFVDDGMQLVLSERLPALVKRELAPLIDDFLDEHHLRRSDLRHYVTHPGGARVVDAYRESLALDGEELALTEAALHDHGNVSSVSVLLVLERWLSETAPQTPGLGLISAFGPGFSAEMLLFETGDW